MRGARPQHLSQDDADGQAARGYPSGVDAFLSLYRGSATPAIDGEPRCGSEKWRSSSPQAYATGIFFPPLRDTARCPHPASHHI
jgi:hypothetical protein